jgi:hypothetical protein
VIDYFPLPSHENAASFGEIISEARERKTNAIRRLKRIIDPAFVHLLNNVDILVIGRETLGCLEKIVGLICGMDGPMDGLRNEVTSS